MGRQHGVSFAQKLVDDVVQYDKSMRKREMSILLGSVYIAEANGWSGDVSFVMGRDEVMLRLMENVRMKATNGNDVLLSLYLIRDQYW